MPRHHLATRDVFHHGEIREDALEWDVCDVGTEHGVRSALIKHSLQFVGKDAMLETLLHDGFVWVSSPDIGDESILPHEALYLLVIHLGKVHFDAPPSIPAAALVEDGFDFEIVFVVFVRLVCRLQPAIVPASGDMSEVAENLHVSS